MKTIKDLKEKASSGAKLTDKEIKFLMYVADNPERFVDNSELPEELMTDEELTEKDIKAIKAWGKTLKKSEPIKHPTYIKE